MKDHLKIDLNQHMDKLQEMGFFIQDIENGIAYPNKFWEKLGYNAEEMKNDNFLHYIHPDDRESIALSIKNSFTNTGKSRRNLFRIRSRDGEWRWVSSSFVGTKYSEDGKLLSYIGFDQDITAEVEAKRRAENALKEAESLLKATEIISSNLDFKNAVDAILQQAADVFSLTSASVMLLEADVLEIVGWIGLSEEYNNIPPHFHVDLSIPNYKVIREKSPYIINCDLKKRYPGFSDCSIYGIKSWMGIPLIYKNRLLGMIAFDHSEEYHFNDSHIRLARAFASQVAIILENSRLYEKVKMLAAQDELTGCCNRRRLFECLRYEMEKSERYKTPLSLILFDVDDFKHINDIHGHLFGDHILKNISRIAAECLRKSDILSRYGGEEFVILMPATAGAEAVIVAERIRRAIEEDQSNSIAVTVSVGCTSLGCAEDKNIHTILERADSAMYQSKAGGKNRVTLVE